MPDFDLGTGKRLAGYSLVLGIVYLVFGLIEVFGGTGETIPGDVFLEDLHSWSSLRRI